jgi:hypothetical protein
MDNFKYYLSNIQENKLVIPINNDYLLSDNDESISLFVDTMEKENTNEIIDYEKLIYDLTGDTSTISFNFLNENKNQTNSFTSQSFYRTVNGNIDYSDSNKISLVKSFFRLDIYDSVDPNTSTLLDEIIIPVVLCDFDYVIDGEKDRIKFYKPIYTLGNNKPMSTIGISYSNLDLVTDNKVYMKCTFFNSRTGRRINFMNSNLVLTYGDSNNSNTKFEESLRYQTITLNDDKFSLGDLSFYQDNFI